MTITNNRTTVRYKLIAQNRGDQMVIEIVDQKLFMIRTAREILKDEKLVNGFSPEHAARIGIAAGMALVA
jgi:hypothetical protein